MKTHQVNFKVSLKAQLESDGSDTKVNTTLILEVDSLTGKIGCIIWPTIQELNSVRSKEDRLGQVAYYNISQVQKTYDKSNS